MMIGETAEQVGSSKSSRLWSTASSVSMPAPTSRVRAWASDHRTRGHPPPPPEHIQSSVGPAGPVPVVVDQGGSEAGALGEDTRADRAQEALAGPTAMFGGRPRRLNRWSSALIVCIGHSSSNYAGVARLSTGAGRWWLTGLGHL
jgi:hypothetical protein